MREIPFAICHLGIKLHDSQTLTTHTTTIKYATKQDRLIRNVSGLDLNIACNDGVKDCT